jgi:hypothetical protein
MEAQRGIIGLADVELAIGVLKNVHPEHGGADEFGSIPTRRENLQPAG